MRLTFFYLSKTEGLGMASIRIANCMELPVGRMASRLAVYLLFPSFLIPYNAIDIDSMLAVGEIPYRNELRIPSNAAH